MAIRPRQARSKTQRRVVILNEVKDLSEIEMDYYGYRYLEADEFARHCAKVASMPGQETWESSRIRDELEYWEKEKCFWPASRIIYPSGYILACYESSRVQRPVENIEQVWPAEWVQLNELINKERSFRSFHPKEIFHPFDSPGASQEFFIEPQRNEFKPWNDYRVPVQERGHTLSTDGASHLYHYWQVYELDALRRLNRIILTVHLTDEVIEGLWRDPLQTVPSNAFRISTGSTYIVSAAFLSANRNCFEILGKYVEATSHLLQIADQKAKPRGRGSYIPAAAMNKYEKRCEEVANRFVANSNVDEKHWYEFTRRLCDLVIEYDSYGRTGLAKSLREDVKALQEMLRYMYGRVSFEELNERVGSGSRGPSYGALRDVLPDEWEDLKKKVVRIFRSHAQVWNTAVHNELQLQESEITSLYDYLDKNDLAQLPLTMVEFQHDLGQRDEFRRFRLYKVIRELSVASEDFLTTSLRQMKVKKFGTTLRANKIEVAFREHSWYSMWNEALNGVKSLRSFNGMDERVSQILAFTDAKRPQDRFIANQFLLFLEARNNSSHTIRLNKRVYEEYLFDVVNAVLNTVFYTWKTRAHLSKKLTTYC